jgi:membrane protein DedA with SNARE-associated domain
MFLALWLLQATPDTPADSSTTTIRWVAGILAVALIVIIFVRRKRKASKEDWT